MTKCPNCSRTFLSDRFPIHAKSCPPAKPAKPAGYGKRGTSAEVKSTPRSQRSSPNKSIPVTRTSSRASSRGGVLASRERSKQTDRTSVRNGPSRDYEPAYSSRGDEVLLTPFLLSWILVSILSS